MTVDELLLAAARSDNEESLLEAMVDNADINCQDGCETPIYLLFMSSALTSVLQSG